MMPNVGTDQEVFGSPVLQALRSVWRLSITMEEAAFCIETLENALRGHLSRHERRAACNDRCLRVDNGSNGYGPFRAIGATTQTGLPNVLSFLMRDVGDRLISGEYELVDQLGLLDPIEKRQCA
jgi:hypothetical protein